MPRTFWDKLAAPDERNWGTSYLLMHGAPIETPSRDLWAHEKQLPALKVAMKWRDKILTDRIDWGKGYFYPDVPRLTKRSPSGRVTLNLVADYIEWRGTNRGRGLWVREAGDTIVLMIESRNRVRVDDARILERWLHGELSGIINLPPDQRYTVRTLNKRDGVVTGRYQVADFDKMLERRLAGDCTQGLWWWQVLIFATDGQSLVLIIGEHEGDEPNFSKASFRYPDRF